MRASTIRVSDIRKTASDIAIAKSTTSKFVKSEPVVVCQQWQAYLDDHFAARERCRHDALEEPGRRNIAPSGFACGDDCCVERGRDHAPLRRRVRVRETAAQCAARANWNMRDVTNDAGKQRTEGPRDHRQMERSVTRQGTDGQFIAACTQMVERGDLVDVDQVGWVRDPEGHHRH
jgi:hypothetical protein